jgi:hypothetical protein
MAKRPNTEERPAVQAAAPVQGSPARLTDSLSDMVRRNPAPDGSPSREPTGIYRIISGNR